MSKWRTGWSLVWSFFLWFNFWLIILVVNYHMLTLVINWRQSIIILLVDLQLSNDNHLRQFYTVAMKLLKCNVNYQRLVIRYLTTYCVSLWCSFALNTTATYRIVVDYHHQILDCEIDGQMKRRVLVENTPKTKINGSHFEETKVTNMIHQKHYI